MLRCSSGLNVLFFFYIVVIYELLGAEFKITVRLFLFHMLNYYLVYIIKIIGVVFK